ncbi:hypothetical protein [Carnobacterium maltaromaticum]|uniref:hypothetical protein n=1 Tax=Carnobacterium maltaromaticum TaxID=2751 RepID=UPI0012F94065|nr:hypothetical protein [Carnobacterium maltaromaticum]
MHKSKLIHFVGVIILTIPIWLPTGVELSKSRISATEQDSTSQDAEAEVGFFFSESYLRGKVNEDLFMQIKSDHPTKEVVIQLPKEANIQANPTATTTIVTEISEGHYRVSSETESTNFDITLNFEKPGDYSISLLSNTTQSAEMAIIIEENDASESLEVNGSTEDESIENEIIATEENEPDSAEDTKIEKELVEPTISVENEHHLRAILLGEIFTFNDGTSINYGEITDDKALSLAFNDDLELTTPILGVNRKNVTFYGDSKQVSFSQSAAANFIEFSSIELLTVKNIRFTNILNGAGFMHTVGSAEMIFSDTSFVANNSTGQFIQNEAASVTFSGEIKLETTSIALPILFTANNINFQDTFLATISGTGANALLRANQVEFGNNSSFELVKSNHANTGSVINLIGNLGEITMAENSTVTVNQTGMFVSVPNDNQDSIFSMKTGAIFNGGLGQGFSGNSASTIGEVNLSQGSEFNFTEYGTVAGNPVINVGRKFTTENSTSATNGVLLTGTRTGTTTGAYIHLRNANSIAELGNYTSTKIVQQGPMFTGVATTQLTIKDNATIDNTHSFGFTGSVAVDSIDIGNNVSLMINEPSNAVVGTAYNTFFARNKFTMGNNSTIVAPRMRTTATGDGNSLIRLNLSSGTVNIGENNLIEANHRGALIHAPQSEVTIGENTEVTATLGRGVTNASVVQNFVLKNGATMIINEHTGNMVNNARFNVRGKFLMETNSSIKSTRTSVTTTPFVALSVASSQFIMEEKTKLDIHQTGAMVTGLNTSDVIIGNDSVLDINSARGITGSDGGTSTVLRKIDIGQRTKVILTEHATNANQNYFRFRDEILIREDAEVIARRTSNNAIALMRLTRPNSKLTMLDGSSLDINQLGPALRGESTTDVSLGNNTKSTINTGRGFTQNNTIRSFTLGNEAEFTYEQPTSGNLAPAASLNVAAFRVSQRFELGQNAVFKATRDRTTTDSRFIWLTGANSVVQLGKNSTFDVSQSGGIFQVQPSSNLNLDQGAKLNVLTERGLNTGSGGTASQNVNNTFRTITVGKEADFTVKDGWGNQRTTAEFINRPLVNVGTTLNIGEGADVLLETTINKSVSSGVLYFRQGNANLNLDNVNSFELGHPTAVSGGSNGNLQRLIRSSTNTAAAGLRINSTNQKLSVWEGANTTSETSPTEEFLNLSTLIRINRNNGNSANGLPANWTGGMNGTSRSFLMTVESATGTIASTNKNTDIQEVIAKNNYSRIRFSEPEGLVARINPISDQSTEIKGFMYENSTIAKITYENTDGETIEITPDSVSENGERMIQWEEYRDENELYRFFTIKLKDNERLETGTNVNVFLSNPEDEFYTDFDMDTLVSKGVEYEAFNITLDMAEINKLSSEEELHQLIIKESMATAKNILTKEDLTDSIRVIDTNVTTAVSQDGTYIATLEVGNKAYSFDIGVDVTSNLDQLSIRIPTKMIFQSMYNAQESNREFESEEYEIRNNSQIPVDVKVNRLEIEDSQGIILLREGEDPLDYAEADPDSEEENPILTEKDISSPLLQLNLVTDRSKEQLYQGMSEKDLLSMAAREEVALSLQGTFYGDYPQWIVDSESEQGGYYESNLTPNYRFVLRFIPQ